MIRNIICCSLMTLTSVARAQSPVGDRCFADSARELRQRLPALLDSAVIPGIALAIIDRGELLWSGGLGSRGSQGGKISAAPTVVEAASLRRPVVAYAALKLVDSGMLDLDQPLMRYASY